jgi:hypothetical protein
MVDTQRSAVFVQAPPPEPIDATEGRRFYPVIRTPYQQENLRLLFGARPLELTPPGRRFRPLPVPAGAYYASRTRQGHACVSPRPGPGALGPYPTLSAAWDAARSLPGASPAPQPERNTTRERARRGRQASAWPVGAGRREKRRDRRNIEWLFAHYRRAHEGRETWARITIRQRCAKVAEYREAMARLATLREFNRLIEEHNAKHSPLALEGRQSAGMGVPHV